MVWDVASEHGIRVVVANPLTISPVSPVHGAMIAYRSKADESFAYPPGLVARWQPTSLQDSSEKGFAERYLRLEEEVDFTIDLFREYDVELGVYYTHFVDTESHWNWDFHARDAFFLHALPKDLDDGAWERLVVDNVGDRAFRAYTFADAVLGRFLEAFPHATFLVCSDHGWTYSGYEHFGAQDGVLMISGPGVTAGGTLLGASTVDVTPTVLSLLDLPLSRELEGEVLSEAFLAVPATRFVDTYGSPTPSPAKPVVDEEELERLRALGYLR